MSIYDWEFWVLLWFAIITLFIICWKRLCDLNNKADEVIEKHCKHTENPCDCLRHHQDEDYKEKLGGLQ